MDNFTHSNKTHSTEIYIKGRSIFWGQRDTSPYLPFIFKPNAVNPWMSTKVAYQSEFSINTKGYFKIISACCLD